ncbi:MAG: TetR/AcrR family transcriptional regulator [Novosphingobium sp.]|nr:TetR/AcrR family transcriptional regulator [Novosphingobium sp.]
MNAQAIQLRMLKAMHPEHGAAPPEKWQQRKSAQTRQKLVAGGIDCLVEGGYSSLTTAAVAERCGVSRGAMHHHFPTRMELVAAVVDHVFYRHMALFLEDYFAALSERGEQLLFEVACEAHWRSVHRREYTAYLELAVAARTDVELATHFEPVSRRFDEVWTKEMIEAFPQWEAHWDVMKLASDLASSVHLGMLLQEPVFGNSDRMEQLRSFVIDAVRRLYQQTQKPAD